MESGEKIRETQRAALAQGTVSMPLSSERIVNRGSSNTDILSQATMLPGQFLRMQSDSKSDDEQSQISELNESNVVFQSHREQERKRELDLPTTSGNINVRSTRQPMGSSVTEGMFSDITSEVSNLDNNLDRNMVQHNVNTALRIALQESRLKEQLARQEKEDLQIQLRIANARLQGLQQRVGEGRADFINNNALDQSRTKAQGRFDMHDFDHQADLIQRRRIIESAINAVGTLGVVDIEERNHYRVLLRVKRLHTSQAIAQRSFDAHRFDTVPNLGVRRQAITAALAAFRDLSFEDRDEKEHYQALLEDKLCETSRAIAEEKFNIDPRFSTALSLDVRLQNFQDALAIDSLDITDVVEQRKYKELLEQAIRNVKVAIEQALQASKKAAQDRFNEHHFERVLVVVQRQQSIQTALDALNATQIPNVAEYAHYRQLLVTALENLNVSVAAAVNRFNAFNFAAQPVTQRRQNIISQINAITPATVPNADERTHYQALLTQARDALPVPPPAPVVHSPQRVQAQQVSLGWGRQNYEDDYYYLPRGNPW